MNTQTSSPTVKNEIEPTRFLSGDRGIGRLAAYSRFIKIEHTLFSLPLLYAGAVLAEGRWPSLHLTLWIFLAGTGGRTLALSLNRLIDRRIDGKNPRTASRELATGALRIRDALLVCAASLLLYIWAAIKINEFCLMWSWAPVLLFLIYPTLKRFTWFSHMGLGVTWAMAPLAGWFAAKPGFSGSWPAWILAAFSFFWLSGFDVIYATLDEEFDRSEGLFSLPARFGRKKALHISSALHGAAFLCLVVLYGVSLTGVSAAFFLLLSGFLLFIEHLLVDSVDFAFFNVNVAAGFVVFIMVLLGVKGDF